MSIRQDVMEWWNNLKDYTVNSPQNKQTLTTKYFGNERSFQALTGLEIERIYDSEIGILSPNEIYITDRDYIIKKFNATNRSFKKGDVIYSPDYFNGFIEEVTDVEVKDSEVFVKFSDSQVCKYDDENLIGIKIQKEDLSVEELKNILLDNTFINLKKIDLSRVNDTTNTFSLRLRIGGITFDIGLPEEMENLDNNKSFKIEVEDGGVLQVNVIL